MARRFVVTGCQRSATAYTAAVLSRVGFPCGHEAIFGVYTVQHPRPGGPRLSRYLQEVFPRFRRPHELVIGQNLPWPETVPGDASWLAAAYLDRLPAGSVVLHQVRDPLAVLRSLRRVRAFDARSPYRAFAEFHCPAVRRGTPLERGMMYWVEWNRLAARAAEWPHLRYLRYRVEDLNPGLLERILTLLGGTPAVPSQSALEAVPTDLNTREPRDEDTAISWGSLPEGRARRTLIALAAGYGYPHAST